MKKLFKFLAEDTVFTLVWVVVLMGLMLLSSRAGDTNGLIFYAAMGILYLLTKIFVELRMRRRDE